jgi:hypothetical protein
MSIIGSNILAGASGQAGGGGAYQISRSVRFSSSDSAFLSRTPGTAGNRKTWTWAGWVKRSELGTDTWVLRANSGGADFLLLGFGSGNQFYLTYTAGVGGAGENYTSAVLRDPSAWYHLVCAFDSTQATASNRIRLYVNGVQQTLAVSNPPTLNADYQVNTTNEHRIGGFAGSYADFYLADIHFIDGQALDPSSFTEFDDNGVWQPKAFSGGSFGTNGFRLPFSDNSTAAALGTDTSGNGNTWTVNNISVTAGAGNDSLVDSPTNYGTDSGVGNEVRGNYATLNPLANGGNTLSNGNLQAVGAVDKTTLATIGMSSGKWYCEVTVDNVGGSCAVGIAKGGITLSNWIGNSPEGWAYGMNGLKYTNNNGGLSYGNTYTTGDIVGIAFDADAGSLYFYKNGTVQNSGTAAFTGLTSGPYFFAFGANAPSVTFNFGQRPFAYTAPSGFKALCTTNLPEPTIADGSTVMDVALYTGNGSTQTISGLNFSPDLIWIKTRSAVEHHVLVDAVRGTGKNLFSSTTSAEETSNPYGSVTAFNSDGFAVGGGSIDQSRVNGNSVTHAWCWDAGSSTVTNTAGSITSQVRANASAGFSVVTYTGNGTANASVGHGLNIAPDFVIAKTRSKSDGWNCYHRSLGNAKPIALNSTNAAATNDTAVWGTNAGPTSSVFYVNYPGSPVYTNENNTTYVAYCFAPVAGYSAYGSYTGNGSADGPFVYTGFRPRWVMIKASSFSTEWLMLDTARSDFNFVNDRLQADSSAAEDTVADMDILSNGFKMRSALMNNNAATFIYAAFAENPFQYARAR